MTFASVGIFDNVGDNRLWNGLAVPLGKMKIIHLFTPSNFGNTKSASTITLETVEIGLPNFSLETIYRVRVEFLLSVPSMYRDARWQCHCRGVVQYPVQFQSAATKQVCPHRYQ